MRSLRFKIIAPFLLGSLFLTVFLSYYTHRSAREAVKESVLLIARAQTKNVSDSMSLLFRSMATSVQKMTTDPHVLEIFNHKGNCPYDVEEETENWFEIITQGNEYYRGILIVDAAGKCVGSNSRMQIGVSYASRPYVQTALGGEFALSDVGVGSTTKNLTATAAAPVYIDGEIVGAVAMTNDFPAIVNYEQAGQGGVQSVFTAILAPDGSFISHRDKALMEKGTRFPELYATLAAAKNGDDVEYMIGHKRYVGHAVVEPTTGWVIVAGGAEGEVFRHAQNLSIVVFFVSLAALLLVSFVVVRTVNGVLDSLLSLITCAKQVSEGDLSIKPAGSNRTDELGILHRALLTMVEGMQRMVVQSQQASNMKSQFLANMSHEIRTPLNAVIGMAHLYLADNGQLEKKRDYIVKIRVAAKTLLGIINNILDISKIEAGMFELDHTPFNLRDIIEQVLSIHQGNAAAKGLSLNLQYAQDLPRAFVGDPVRIEQVLNNLTGNAIKFTEQGGVEIRCELAEQPDADGRLLLRVSVTDTGLGIHEDKLEALFKPFTQADTSITRRFGGTGLGLAISSKIVDMLGGEFTVESTPDAGAVFSFTMRLAPDSEAPPEVQEPEHSGEGVIPINLSGKRILVAEDNLINQMLMEELLRPTGAVIVMAENGKLAVEAAQKEHFDLVLMDMQMPVMDGIQAAREIRALAGCEGLPIVAVTANAMKEDKDQGLAAGLNDYITKPIEPHQLLLALKRWIK